MVAPNEQDGQWRTVNVLTSTTILVVVQRGAPKPCWIHQQRYMRVEAIRVIFKFYSITITYSIVYI